jgi:hypothetical protein
VSNNVTIQDHNISLAEDLIYYAGSSSNYYIFYNTTDSKWDNEKVSNSASPAATSKTALYKVKDMRDEQNPQFSAAAAEYDLYTKTWTVAIPTLSGAQGTVTYESSNTAVVTVDASSGDVTIANTARKGNTAVITANAAGNDNYKPGSASYTISIVNSNTNVTKYEKVTSTADLEAGAQYLIVFEGLAGDTDGDGSPKVFDPVLKEGDETQFAKATSSALDATINSGIIESTEFDDCLFTLEDGYYLKADKVGKYIYPGASGSSSAPLAEATQSHALTITFENGNAMIKYDTRYIVWSTYSHYFSANTGFSSTNYSTYICLYKKDDGRQKQELTISSTSATYDLYHPEAFTAPTVTAQTSSFTYRSDDETVATVNSEGKVVGKKVGSTKITITALGDTQFSPASISYTLTVIDTTPIPQTISFSKSEVSYNMKSSAAFVKPTLSGAVTTPNYSSSDESVATVDANGDITFKKAGQTVISAKAPYGTVDGKDYLESNEATYTLIVTDDEVATTTYYKANMIVTGVEYLIVSNGQALVNNNGSAGATPVAVNDAQIQLETDTGLLWKAEADGGKFNFSNNGQYLRRNTSNTGNIGIGNKSNTARNNQWSYDATNEYLTVQGSGTSKYYLGYSTSWSIGSSGTAALYSTTPPSDPSTYKLITEKGELESGATYLIVSSDSGNYNGLDHKSAFVGDTDGTAVDVSASEGVITGYYSAYEFVITLEGTDVYSLKGPNGYVTGNENSGSRYIQVSSSKVEMSLTDAATLQAATSTDGKVADAFYFYYTKTSTDGSTSKEVLYMNSDKKFKIGGSGRKYGVYLYKKDNPSE